MFRGRGISAMNFLEENIWKMFTSLSSLPILARNLKNMRLLLCAHNSIGSFNLLTSNSRMGPNLQMCNKTLLQSIVSRATVNKYNSPEYLPSKFNFARLLWTFLLVFVHLPLLLQIPISYCNSIIKSLKDTWALFIHILEDAPNATTFTQALSIASTSIKRNSLEAAFLVYVLYSNCRKTTTTIIWQPPKTNNVYG